MTTGELDIIICSYRESECINHMNGMYISIQHTNSYYYYEYILIITRFDQWHFQ